MVIIAPALQLLKLYKEMERMWQWKWSVLRYYPSISLDQLRKTLKTISKDSWPPDRNLNMGPLNTNQE
jgi:hypothetical protein